MNLPSPSSPNVGSAEVIYGMYVHLVRLFTLLPPRSGPALLSAGVQERWQDEMARKDWYEQGKQYWAQSDLSNAGVLSGLEFIHDSDIEDSFDFLTRQPFGDNGAPLWPLPEQPSDTVALDVGAGIGRVSGALLRRLCSSVDLVDGCQQFVEHAQATLGQQPPPEGCGRMTRFECRDLQDYVPEAGRYHLIWIQWVVGQCTDADLTRLLGDCKQALAPGGVIIVKDNVLENLEDGMDYLVDEEDKSVIRSREALLHLLQNAGLNVMAAADARLDCEGLHPVMCLALM